MVSGTMSGQAFYWSTILILVAIYGLILLLTIIFEMRPIVVVFGFIMMKQPLS